MLALIDELKKPQYQGISDQQAADLLNVLTITKRRLVPTAVAKQYAIEEGFYPRIVIDSQSSLDAAKQELCLGVWLWVDDPTGKIANIDMNLPIAKKMIAGLLHYQYITQQQAVGLDHLANHTVRWLDDIGVGSVSAESIKVAREEISGVAEARQTMLREGAERWNRFVNAVQDWDGASETPVL
jgi:hypothetical protein